LQGNGLRTHDLDLYTYGSEETALTSVAYLFTTDCVRDWGSDLRSTRHIQAYVMIWATFRHTEPKHREHQQSRFTSSLRWLSFSYGYTVSVCNQPPGSTQPPTLSGMENECRQWQWQWCLTGNYVGRCTGHAVAIRHPPIPILGGRLRKADG